MHLNSRVLFTKRKSVLVIQIKVLNYLIDFYLFLSLHIINRPWQPHSLNTQTHPHSPSSKLSFSPWPQLLQRLTNHPLLDYCPGVQKFWLITVNFLFYLKHTLDLSLTWHLKILIILYYRICFFILSYRDFQECTDDFLNFLKKT